MTPLLLVSLWVVCLGKTKKYHTSDPALMAAKKRLLAPMDDAGKNGGIRARIGPVATSMDTMNYDMADLNKGVNVLKKGQEYIEPLFVGVSEQYMHVGKAVNAFMDKLDLQKEKTDKAISRFAQDWTSALEKRRQEDPAMNTSVFNYFNTFVLQMYSLLNRVSSMVDRQLTERGTMLYTGNRMVADAQNKTLAALARQVVTTNLLFSRMLNGNALPTIATAKSSSAGNLVRVKKDMLDSTDILMHAVIPQTQSEGSTYLEAGASKLLLAAQKQVVQFTTQVQKSLVRMRAQLRQTALKDSTAVSRNLTSINTQRTAGAREIETNRKNAKAKIIGLISQGLSFIDNFKVNIVGSMHDLGGMLTAGDAELNAAAARAKLDAQQIDAQTSATIAALFSPSVQSAGHVSGANSIQSQISNLFNSQQKTDVGIKHRVTTALSDAEEASMRLSGQFGAIATDGGSNLQAKIGVQTAQLQAKQGTAVSRVGDSAKDVQFTIDSATADNEDDQAAIINKYANAVTSKDSILGTMGDLNAQIAARQKAARDAALTASKGLLGGLESSKSVLTSEDEEISSMERRLAAVADGAVPQLDAQNEARIRDAFGQLNSLHRLSAGNGDLLESNSNKLITDLIRKAKVEGFAVDTKSVNALGASVVSVHDASKAYQSQAADFEAGMNREMHAIASKFAGVENGTNNDPISQIVAHSNMIVSNEGRDLIRSIYKSSSANGLSAWIASNPKFNVNKFLGFLLNDTGTLNVRKTVQAQLSDLGSKSATAKKGIDQYVQYLMDMKRKIESQYFFNQTEDDSIVNKLIKSKAMMEADLTLEKQELNESITHQFGYINESISNKTINFYKQFQTASIVADAIVAGFAEYVHKMIAVENMTANQRAAMEAHLIDSIQAGSDAMPTNITSSDDIKRVHDLVRLAMDASDTSAEGMARRAAANEALLAMVGAQSAQLMKDRYTKLAANAAALSKSIDASQAELVAERVGSLAGSKMGINGINAAGNLFSNQAQDMLETQKHNGKLLEAKIDQLLTGSSFLTNITASELGEILKSIQNSNNLHHSQQSRYQEESASQVATLGGVIQSFAQLVTIAIDETTDYLNKLSANYTALVTRTDAIATLPVNKVKQEVIEYRTVAENVKNALNTQLLSITPIEEGLSERMASMRKQQDTFAENTQKQLADFVNNVHQMQGDISTSREAGMKRLHASIAAQMKKFRDTALELQSMSVDKLGSSSFVEKRRVRRHAST